MCTWNTLELSSDVKPASTSVFSPSSCKWRCTIACHMQPRLACRSKETGVCTTSLASTQRA